MARRKNKLLNETQLLSLSLVFGAPDSRWMDQKAFYNDHGSRADDFRVLLRKVKGDNAFMGNGISYHAQEYTEWYQQQEAKRAKRHR